MPNDKHVDLKLPLSLFSIMSMAHIENGHGEA